MHKYIVTKKEIEEFEGVTKSHFLNKSALRVNKSLGDLTGLTGIGFHIIEVQANTPTTEKHMHYFEDECVYILEGEAQAVIGEQTFSVSAGDFIGYRAGGLAHALFNTGESILKCIVVGQRLEHDVGDYPEKNKRIYRQKGMPWQVVDLDHIDIPNNVAPNHIVPKI